MAKEFVKSPGLSGFIDNFSQTLKEEITLILQKFYGKIENVRKLLSSFYETIITSATKFYKDITRNKYKPIFILNLEVKILSEFL